MFKKVWLNPNFEPKKSEFKTEHVRVPSVVTSLCLFSTCYYGYVQCICKYFCSVIDDNLLSEQKTTNVCTYAYASSHSSSKVEVG